MIASIHLKHRQFFFKCARCAGLTTWISPYGFTLSGFFLFCFLFVCLFLFVYLFVFAYGKTPASMFWEKMFKMRWDSKGHVVWVSLTNIIHNGFGRILFHQQKGKPYHVGPCKFENYDKFLDEKAVLNWANCIIK